MLEFLKADKSLEPIWDKIKARVEAELWDEFQSAYGQNRSHPQFVALINNGQYIDIPDFSAVETKLQTSEARLNLERYSLWANRQFNPEAQKDFDKQYGLILK